MRLDEFFRADLVTTDLRAVDRASVLSALADHLAAMEPSLAAEAVQAALTAREDAHTTAMGRGMALPHATVAGLAEPVLTVAVAPDPIQFGPPDADPIRVFFVLLSPPGYEGVHIKLLARVCRLAHHEGFLEQLAEARTNQRVVDVIRHVDDQHV